jgi:C_GCAxxG_C_C family probable redox protein
MENPYNRRSIQIEALVAKIKERTRNLYLTRQLLCAEAVLVALNQGLNGCLSDAQAVAVAAPFSNAMGESGCMCGALSGAVMACGLFLGNRRPYAHRMEIRKVARQLHDAFKDANGSTCCRVISRDVRHHKKTHFKHCANVTAETAELAARLILKKRPEVIKQANYAYLSKRPSKIGAAIARLLRLFS